MEKNFLEVGLINLEIDNSGNILQEKVYSRLANIDNKELHSYGKGPFCRFSISSEWKDKTGIYALITEEKILYIGYTVNLYRAFSYQIGRISPSDCYKGGQITNCRLNHYILSQNKEGKDVTLAFYETTNYKSLKDRLIKKYSPEWNLQR